MENSHKREWELWELVVQIRHRWGGGGAPVYIFSLAGFWVACYAHSTPTESKMLIKHFLSIGLENWIES